MQQKPFVCAGVISDTQPLQIEIYCVATVTAPHAQSFFFLLFSHFSINVLLDVEKYMEEGELIVFVGCTLEAMTNNYLSAVNHLVV